MSDILEEALLLQVKGLPLTLCKGKQPLGEGWGVDGPGKNWPRKVWSPAEIRLAFKTYPKLNLGIQLGPKSGVIDIDADTPEAPRLLQELFDGPPPVTTKSTSKRGHHWWFQWDQRLAVLGKTVIHYGGPAGLEIRLGAGRGACQSLIPPSETDGFTREWLPGLSLHECPPAPLPDSVLEKLMRAGKERVNTENTEDTETQKHMPSVFSVLTRRAVRDAIKATIPTGEGFRNRQLFSFVRKLKAIAELRDMDAVALKPFVREWHQMALKFIKTKSFDVTWMEFCYGWENAEFAEGEGPLGEAYAAALDEPLPPAALKYDLPSLQRLVALCYQLQLRAGDKPFFLACRDAGSLLRISAPTAHKWLKHLLREKVLQLVTLGTPGRASEYRYIG